MYLLWIVLGLILLGIIRSQHQDVLTLRYKYKLFALRDKLRTYCIEKKIDSHSWSFIFLDETISKSVGRLNNLNVFSTILNSFMGGDMSKAYSEKIKIESAQNPYVKEIYKELGELLAGYTFRKHLTVTFSLFVGLISVLLSISYFKKIKRNFSQSISNDVTEDFFQYC